MGNPADERVENPVEYIDCLARSILPLGILGFQESYRSDREIIFDSQWCRVSFVWSGWEMYSGNSLSVFYGRLHAPDDETRMVWNGEQCYCWHSLAGTGAALDFLDRLKPEESARRKTFPRIIQQFRQSSTWQDLAGKRRDPELAMRLTAFIWEHYGLRLFELFDLRWPELWEGYRAYLKEVARITEPGRRKGFGGPAMLPGWQVC